jgi:hypothetical protein
MFWQVFPDQVISENVVKRAVLTKKREMTNFFQVFQSDFATVNKERE